jgi:hypothetical protein
MKKLHISIFLLVMLMAFVSAITSYKATSTRISEDVNNALALTKYQMPCDVVSADTIRCYRNNITIVELRDTAYLAMRTVRRGNHQETELIAEANCDFATIFMLSDQRASASLVVIGMLWLIGSTLYVRRHRPELIVQGIAYGGLIFNNDRFCNATGERIHLTPMQHTLLEMFLKSDDHTLTKQEICDRLWPKKPDANDTLYTLIRRIKPIIETNSNLKIESDRGRSYSLEVR